MSSKNAVLVLVSKSMINSCNRGWSYLFKRRCTSGAWQNIFYWVCDKSMEKSAINVQFDISVFVL